MFTGLVECTGEIRQITAKGGDLCMRFAVPEGFCVDVSEGDSISISGVCLTAIEIDATGFSADLSGETMRLTSLGRRSVGDSVNLEKALLPSSRLGGHFVSGHVDGTGVVHSISEQARSQIWHFLLPAALMRFVAVKGSVCVDGVSLTVNTVEELSFSVNLIPHTLSRTTLAQRKVGDLVNIEVDLIARYLARLNGLD